MNIVYLLTNKTKTEGKRFYIGSKVECKLLEIEGVPTIYNMKTKKPYYSSSTNFEFLQDFRDGHIFEASVLEVIIGRNGLREAENNHIRRLNAVGSEEFYNMSEAFANTYDSHGVKNKYGETIAEYASRCSQVGKRDGTARELGFKNFGELYFKIQERLDAGEGVQKISSSFGKHRKWVPMTLEPYDMEKAKKDILIDRSEELRQHLSQGCSLKLSALLLNLELPAARVMLGDFGKSGERNYSVASSRGKSKEELELEIVERVLNGEGFIEIGNTMSLVRESVLRYFLRGLRSKKLEILEVFNELRR